MCRRTPLSWKESFEQGTVPVPQSAGRVRGGRVQCPACGVPVPNSAWTAGFVSKSNSYKAWIGSEEAKQTRLKSEGDQVSA